jgi:hypothetical protein
MANNVVGSLDQVRKRLTYTTDLISTSYHEAGHTVYGLLHFMKVNSVWVFENKKCKRVEGFTHYELPVDFSELKDFALCAEIIKSEICLKYAGLAAEKYHFKSISGSDKYPLFLRDGSSDDTLTAAALLREYNLVPPGKKRYNFKKKLIKNTLEDLQDNWDAVTIIAHALFKKKRLSYMSLKKLLTKHTNDPEFWKQNFYILDSIFNKQQPLDEKEIKYILFG